jgi:hypothetical protein
MPRPTGVTLPAELRQQGIDAIAGLISAGVPDAEAIRQVVQRFDVSKRTGQKWLQRAYADLARDAQKDRQSLLGVALRRRSVRQFRATSRMSSRTTGTPLLLGWKSRCRSDY